MMKKSVLVFLLAVSLVLLISGVALAQAGKVELKGGWFVPNGDLDEDHWDNGTYGELAATYYESNMGIQGGVGVYTSDLNDTHTDSVLGKVKEDNSLTVIPVTLSLLGYYDNGPLHLYGGGGIGFYFAEIESKLNFKDAGFKWKDSDKDSVFGYHAMAGLEYDITSAFYIGVEGRLIWTNEAEFNLKDKGVKADYKSELGGDVIAAKIGLRF